MKIEKVTQELSLPFCVCVEVCQTGLDGAEIVSVDLMSKDAVVTLDSEQAKELLHVLQGKKCLTIAVTGKDEYQAHTLIYNSASDAHKDHVINIQKNHEDWKK